MMCNIIISGDDL